MRKRSIGLLLALAAALPSAAAAQDPAAGGDGLDTPGLVRAGWMGHEWSLANTFGGLPAHSFTFECCGQVVVGDWDGDGIDTSGVVYGGNHWVLTNGHDRFGDLEFVYGNPGDAPVVGDWNGDGVDTPGVRRGHIWYLSDGFGTVAHRVLGYGDPGDTAVAGDWNGDGVDTPGVRRGHIWYLSDDFAASVHRVVGYGNPGDIALVGDWDGDGIDTPGVRRGEAWYLSDRAGATQQSFTYGDGSEQAVAGDWNPDPIDQGADVADAFGFVAPTGDPAESAPDVAPTAPASGPETDAPTKDGSGFDGEAAASPDGGDSGSGTAPDSYSEPESSAEPSVQPGDGVGATAEDECGTTSAPAPRTGSGVPAVVVRFAPRVHMHTGEEHYPVSPRTVFIRCSELRWAEDGRDELRRGRGQINSIQLGDRTPWWLRYYKFSDANEEGQRVRYLASDCTRPRDTSECDRLGELDPPPRTRLEDDAGFFLDYKGDRTPQKVLNGRPVFYHYSPSRHYITYWFFYPFSAGDPALDNDIEHEGDWERIAILLNDANTQARIVALYRHGCKVFRQWSYMWRVAGTQHPIVFSAKGAHGTYARPGKHRNCSFEQARPDETEINPNGRWDTWNWLHNVQSQPWYGFGGAWGEVGGLSETTGPLGPSRHKRPSPW